MMSLMNNTKHTKRRISILAMLLHTIVILQFSFILLLLIGFPRVVLSNTVSSVSSSIHSAASNNDNNWCRGGDDGTTDDDATSIEQHICIDNDIKKELINPIMLERIRKGDGFLAALDQSGGSTPKALDLYGIDDNSYIVGEDSMFDAIHEMRTRIITSPSFTGDKVLGAILFENTMDRTINAIPTAHYLWEHKRIVPFLKIDNGLESRADGIQLMKPIPNLDTLLQKAKRAGIFGTKMRSVIYEPNPDSIRLIVQQQFTIAKQILRYGLIPIVEPEIDISSPNKEQCEHILKDILVEYLQSNRLDDDEQIIIKLSIPTQPNFYGDLIEQFPNKILGIVALSGGYTREQANILLSQQRNMIASFSRALTEGLSYSMSSDEFDTVLQRSIDSIYEASKSG